MKAGAQNDRSHVQTTRIWHSVANTINTVFKAKVWRPIDVAIPPTHRHPEQVLTLKRRNPTSADGHLHVDAICSQKPCRRRTTSAMLLADDAGYSDPSFLKAVGKISQAPSTARPGASARGLADGDHRKNVQDRR